MDNKDSEKDFFVALSGCRLVGDVSDIMYYPGVQRYFESAMRSMRALAGPDKTPEELAHLLEQMLSSRASDLKQEMDRAGVDVAFGSSDSLMVTTGYATSMSTNGFVLQEIAQHPDRLYFEANVGPVIRRGVEHANWELEYLVKEQNARLCKVYAPEDEGGLDDRRMWPFYEKASELNVPLTVHTGAAYTVPNLDKHARPILLDEALVDFPDLKVIATNMGWPHHEELAALAGKHQNLYISISGILGMLARAPYLAYHTIGLALEWAGPDKILMGLDLPFSEMARCVEFIRNLEIPVELQQKYGYPKITDEIRAKILGLNLARLTGIEPGKRIEAPAPIAH